MSDGLIKIQPLDPRELPEITLSSKYIPEIDYEARKYKPLGTEVLDPVTGLRTAMVGPPGHFCDRCTSYYSRLKKEGLFKPEEYKPAGWPIRCQGDASAPAREFGPDQIEALVQDGAIEDSIEAREEFLLSLDPAAWIEKEVGIKLDWYQKEILHCTSQWKAVRGGRRIGKSTTKEGSILYSLYTKDGKDIDRYEILVVCPYEVQVKKIFDDLIMLIRRSQKLSLAMKRSSKSPWEIEFYNGSVVRGFSSGKKTGARSDKIRSQGANKIYFDETDFMADEDIETILAVMGSQPDTSVMMSTTPTGAHSKFWRFITDKTLRYKEFHYISAESPRWGIDVERMLKSIYSAGGFMREFWAEFGTPTEGVFSMKMLDKSLRAYVYENCQRQGHFKYILGVDWNKVTGTHMVVLERGYKENDGKQSVFYRVVDKIIVRKQEFLHHETVLTLLQLDQKWKCDYIFVDQGYGEVQVENLHREDLKHPELNLRLTERLIAIHGNQTIVLKDPRNPGVEIKKAAKPFMVDLLSSWVDANVIFFPEAEDTHAELIESEIPFLDIGIVQQMREFRIDKYSPTGQPRYSQGYEHTLMAVCFAVLGMAMKFSEINDVPLDGTIVYSPVPLGMPNPENTTTADLEEKRKNDLAAAHKLHEKTRPERTFDAVTQSTDLGIFKGTLSEFSEMMQGRTPPSRRLPYHSPRFGPPKRTIP